MITNFVTAVNGATTSGDYLSILTSNYNDSSYIVSLIINVNLPNLLSIFKISGTIYLNYYIDCYSKSYKLILDPIFYNSGNTEIKVLLDPWIIQNTKNCSGFNFSY